MQPVIQPAQFFGHPVDLLLPVRHRERRPDLDLRISGAVGYLTSRVHNIPVYMEFEGQGILLGNQFCQSLPLNHSLAVGPIDSRNQIGQARNGSIQLLF